ncbi:hypothetical protein Tco_0896122 [Tanacetum coccineum]
MKMEILLEPTSNKLLDNLKMEMEMEIPSVKASANSDIVYFFTSAQDGDPLQDDDGPCGGHPKDETKRTCGVPSLVMLRSWRSVSKKFCSLLFVRVYKTEVRVSQTQFEPMVVAEVVSHCLERGTLDVSHEKMTEFFMFVTPSTQVGDRPQDEVGHHKEEFLIGCPGPCKSIVMGKDVIDALNPDDPAFRVSANGPALGVLFPTSALIGESKAKSRPELDQLARSFGCPALRFSQMRGCRLFFAPGHVSSFKRLVSSFQAIQAWQR